MFPTDNSISLAEWIQQLKIRVAKEKESLRLRNGLKLLMIVFFVFSMR